MKRSLTLLVGAGFLLFGTTQITRAQAPQPGAAFADVPADHWAYQAVDTLQKAGIVIGYPDGTFGGKRTMTRYEFAVGIARLLPLINPPDLAPFPQKSDLQALSDDLDAKLAANRQAIDALQALTDEFKPEFTQLGQDIPAIQKRLDALEQRVAAVEEEQRRVRINGELDIIARGDVSTERDGAGGYLNFLDKNGVQTGRETSNHLLQTSDVYHNFALNLRGKLSDTATVVVRAEFSNYLSAVRNTAAIGYGFDNSGYNGHDAQPGFLTGADSTQTHLREAYVDMPVSLGPLGGATVDVGRIPIQFSKYTLKQVDADVYTSLYETDSGNLPVDGGKISARVGPVGLLGFAGKNDTIPFAQPYLGSQNASIQTLLCGCSLNSIQSRPFGQILQGQASGVAQSAGLRATIGRPGAIQINGTLEEFGLDSIVADPQNGVAYNKVTVYGADANGALPFGLGPIPKGSFGIDASYTNSLEGGLTTHAASGYRYMQHEEQLSLQLKSLMVKGGYQYVGPYFSSPGYWGRIGAWTNPTNIKGPVVSAKFAVTPKVTLNGEYNHYDTAYGNTNSPLQQMDNLNRYQIGVGWGVTSASAVDINYEDVLYHLCNTRNALFQMGNPHETYLTLGLGHTFSPNMTMKLLYQIIRYDDKGTGFDPVDGNGGVAVGQFQVKF